MRDDDPRGTALRDHALKERISQPAGRVFKIPFARRRSRRNIFALDDAFESARAREIFDKPRVSIRFRPSQRVIEMHDEEGDAERVSQAFQQSQQ